MRCNALQWGHGARVPDARDVGAVRCRHPGAHRLLGRGGGAVSTRAASACAAARPAVPAVSAWWPHRNRTSFATNRNVWAIPCASKLRTVFMPRLIVAARPLSTITTSRRPFGCAVASSISASLAFTPTSPIHPRVRLGLAAAPGPASRASVPRAPTLKYWVDSSSSSASSSTPSSNAGASSTAAATRERRSHRSASSGACAGRSRGGRPATIARRAQPCCEVLLENLAPLHHQGASAAAAPNPGCKAVPHSIRPTQCTPLVVLEWRQGAWGVQARWGRASSSGHQNGNRARAPLISARGASTARGPMACLDWWGCRASGSGGRTHAAGAAVSVGWSDRRARFCFRVRGTPNRRAALCARYLHRRAGAHNAVRARWGAARSPGRSQSASRRLAVVVLGPEALGAEALRPLGQRVEAGGVLYAHRRAHPQQRLLAEPLCLCHKVGSRAQLALLHLQEPLKDAPVLCKRLPRGHVCCLRLRGMGAGAAACAVGGRAAPTQQRPRLRHPPWLLHTRYRTQCCGPLGRASWPAARDRACATQTASQPCGPCTGCCLQSPSPCTGSSRGATSSPSPSRHRCGGR